MVATPAGVLEPLLVSTGAPQGAKISPLASMTVLNKVAADLKATGIGVVYCAERWSPLANRIALVDWEAEEPEPARVEAVKNLMRESASAPATTVCSPVDLATAVEQLGHAGAQPAQ